MSDTKTKIWIDGNREDEQRNVSIIGDSEEACEEAMKRVSVKHPEVHGGWRNFSPCEVVVDREVAGSGFVRREPSLREKASEPARGGSRRGRLVIAAVKAKSVRANGPGGCTGHLPSPCKHALGCVVV